MTFFISNNKFGVISIERKAGEAATEYVWKTDSKDISFGFNTTFAIKNNVVCNKLGYILNPDFETISDTTSGVVVDGTTVTVTPTDDWFIQTKDISVDIANATDQEITFVGKYATEKITLTDGKGNVTLPIDTYAVSISGGEIADTSFEVATDITSFSSNFTAVSVKDIDSAIGEVDLIDGVTATVDNEKFNDGDVIGTYFTVVGDSVVKRFKNNAVYAIQTASSDKNNAGNLQFTITKKLKVSIKFCSTGGSNTSELAIMDAASGENVTDVKSVTGTTVNYVEMGTLDAGTYQIYTPYNSDLKRGARLYAVKFEEAEQGGGDVVVPTDYNETLEMRVNPSIASSDNVEATVSTFNGGQHGAQAATVTFKNAPESVKFTVGGCRYGDGTVTVKATDANNKVYTESFSNKTESCEGAYAEGNVPAHTQYVEYLLKGKTNELTAPITVEFTWSNAYVPYIDAVNYEEEVISGTKLNLDFRNGNIITTDLGGGTFYIKDGVASSTETEDFDVKITNVKSHNSGYGLQQSGSFPVITINNVQGPAKITMLGTNYGGYFNAASTGSGNFLNSNGIVISELNGVDATNKGNNNVYYYNGSDTATITLTGTKGSGSATTIYIANLAVETISENDVPAEKYANLNLKVNATGTNAGDEVVIIDSKGNRFASSVNANGVADFTGNIVELGTATVSIAGYTVSPVTIDVTAETTEYAVTAAPTATTAIADSASTDELYVGYAAKDGYKVYNTVQAAVNAASAGSVINVADGSYYGRVVIDKANITLNGTSTAGTVLTYNDSETRNDTYFHGATVAVVSTGFKANNLTIKNTAEVDGAEVENHKNAAALSIGYVDKISADAVITNCEIWATRDTVNIGKYSADSAVTFNSCKIYGFQDVICGAGKATLNDCTWDINSGNNARLFAPIGSSVCVANNVNIINSNYPGKAKAAFARAWGQDKTDPDCTVVINGYTDDGNNIFANNVQISDKNISIYGFEPEFIGKGTGDITNMLWLVRKNTKDNYNTTLSAINAASPAVNVFESSTKIDGEDAYRVIGKVSSDMLDKVDAIGFALYSGNNFVGNMSDSTVYHKEGTTEYYFVSFLDSTSDVGEYTVIPYVSYKGYDVQGSESNGTINIGA